MNKQKGSPEILTQEKSVIYEQIIAHSVHKYDTLQKKKKNEKKDVGLIVSTPHFLLFTILFVLSFALPCMVECNMNTLMKSERVFSTSLMYSIRCMLIGLLWFRWTLNMGLINHLRQQSSDVSA